MKAGAVGNTQSIMDYELFVKLDENGDIYYSLNFSLHIFIFQYNF